MSIPNSQTSSTNNFNIEIIDNNQDYKEIALANPNTFISYNDSTDQKNLINNTSSNITSNRSKSSNPFNLRLNLQNNSNQNNQNNHKNSTTSYSNENGHHDLNLKDNEIISPNLPRIDDKYVFSARPKTGLNTQTTVTNRSDDNRGYFKFSSNEKINFNENNNNNNQIGIGWG